MMSRSMSLTDDGLRKGSVCVRVVKAVQWRQYFCLSCVFLVVTPSAVASHADRTALANIAREVGGIRPMMFAEGGGNVC